MAPTKHIALLLAALAGFATLTAAAARPVDRARESERRELAEAAIARVLPEGQILEEMGALKPLPKHQGALEVEAIFPGGQAFRRRAAVALEWRADGEIVRREQVMATLAIELEVPVAARPIRAGEILDASSVVSTRVRFSDKPSDIALDARDAVGRAAKRDFAMGDVIDRSALELVTVIRRGERISVAAEFGRIVVSTAAIAHEDGCIGERVLAELPATNRLVRVEVTARGQGRVVR